jgi:hypothetical protein
LLSAFRKLKLNPCLTPCTSINSKSIKNLTISPETSQLVQESTGNTLEATGIAKNFLSRTPLTQQLRERMDKWDYMKFKSFCTIKEMVSKLKWEKIFSGYTSKDITRIYRKLKKLHSPKINEQMKKWTTELNRTFSKEEVQMAKKTHEKMLTIPGLKGNSNQNHTKIPPHSF